MNDQLSDIEERQWTEHDYLVGIKRAIYGLWSNKIDAQTAFIQLWTTIEKGLMWAWYNGAAECGIQSDELTQGELAALSDAIFNELQYVEQLIYDVIEHSRDSGTKLKAWYPRLNMWANRYRDVQNQAKMLACGNQKLKWVLGPTEEHCPDCSRIAGKVKRATTWAASGWEPQSHDLACHGYNCLCVLELTDDKLSPGKLPAAPGG